MNAPTVEARLASIETKLDRALDHQRAVAELVEAMTPVAKDMMSVATVKLEDLERKGYFRALGHLQRMLDTVVSTYDDEDLQALGDNVVAILDTVKNLTQAEVLDAASDASEALQHKDEHEPLGRLGLLRSTGDEDVRRGLTVVVEVLRQVGRVRSAGTRAGSAAPAARAPTARAAAPRAATSAAPHSAPPRGAASADPTPPAASMAAAPAVKVDPVAANASPATIAWEGALFYADGFLVEPAAWTPELGTKIALGLGITLGPEHWRVLEWARAEFLQKGASPNVRKVAMGSGVGTATLYTLFPKTPGKSIAMIAGIPKPVGCI